MDQPDREAEPNFTRPRGQFLWMVSVLAAVMAVGVFTFTRVQEIFLASVYLNGFIALVFITGILACFWQVLQLRDSVRWIRRYVKTAEVSDIDKAPRQLASLAALLKTRGARMHINSTSARSILDSVATRIDELRDITRYIVNLLIFLGLLGTFYGLATTVPAIVETIGNLEPKDGETGADVFRRLQSGLQAQMGGMGVAFGSSLLGLAGSLVVGLLELFAGHGQNRFYRELEEWLSSITRLGFASGDSEGVGDQGAMSAMLDHMAEQMETLQTVFTQSDVSRAMVDERLGTLAGSIEKMTERMDNGDANTDALTRVADGQNQLVQLLQNQASLGAGANQPDAESRMRLRSIDVQLLRILEEMAAGRQETTADLRSDIAALTKAVRQMTRDPGAASNRRG